MIDVRTKKPVEVLRGPESTAMFHVAVQQLLEATFLQYLSVFEVFVGDLLRAWLTAHPRAIGGKTLRFEDALDAGDMPTLISQVVDHEVAEVTYKSPRVVFQYLERRIGLPLPAAPEIDRLAEAKATRDTSGLAASRRRACA